MYVVLERGSGFGDRDVSRNYSGLGLLSFTIVGLLTLDGDPTAGLDGDTTLATLIPDLGSAMLDGLGLSKEVAVAEPTFLLIILD